MSTKAYKPHGKIDYTNAGGAIAPNAIVAIGRYVGMALNDIAASTGVGPVGVMDIVAVTKASGAWTQGQEIFYDSGAGNFTTVPTGNTPAGFAALAATSGATTGYVDLCPSWNTFVSPKVVTALLDLNGNELLKVTATTSAVNEITLANAATGGIPSLSATGGDTDVDILVAQKGAAAVQLGAATCTGVQLMADQPILDSAGLELIKFVKTATAVNEITITNNSTGQVPTISSSGESNIGLTVMALGTGTLTLGRATGKVQIGTVGTDYVGFYGTTPAQQPTHVADPAACAAMTATLAGVDTGTDMTAAQAATIVADLGALKTSADNNRTAINSILAQLATLGLQAAS